jgi:hypothetical protein
MSELSEIINAVANETGVNLLMIPFLGIIYFQNSFFLIKIYLFWASLLLLKSYL